MNKAFVEKLLESKLTGPAMNAAEGLRLLGYEVVWFDREDYSKLEITKDTLVVGLINTYVDSISSLGIEMQNFDYPDELSPWLGRKIAQKQIGEVRKESNSWPVFIKPANERKTFTGQLVSKFADLISSATLPKDFLVWASEPVRFVSEYRCFILNGEVVGCKNYKGDVLVFPDSKAITDMVAAWKSAPKAYCLDVGVTDNGQTLLVEVNDAHSAGDYGLHPIIYARFLEARWCELTGASPIP